MSVKILAQALVTASVLYPTISSANPRSAPTVPSPDDEFPGDRDSLDVENVAPNVYQSRPPPTALEIGIEFRGEEAVLDGEEEQILDNLANWLAADSNRVLLIQAPPSVTADGLEEVRRRLGRRGIDPNRIVYAVLAGDQAQNVQIMFLSQTKASEAAPPLARQGSTNWVNEPPAFEQRKLPPHVKTLDGMSLSIGGGVMDFTDEATRAFTGVAGTWEARLAYGTRAPIAAEFAYVGSARTVESLGLDDNAVILGTALEAALRLNMSTNDYVQPYLVAGLGITRWNVVNNANRNTSSVKDSDTSSHVPMGFGLSFRQDGFLLDFRGTFRASVDDHLTSDGIGDDLGDDQPRSHTWQADAKFGWEF